MKIVLAGGSGFLGTALTHRLIRANHHVVLLSRSPERIRPAFPPTVEFERWDASSVGDWKFRLEGADAVINLTGESIASRRWTVRQKELIMSSRLNATEAIVSGMHQTRRRPGTLINASAVGIYGNQGDARLTEESLAGDDFLARVCERWERAAQIAEADGVRVALIRTGIVLDKDHGALEKLLIPFRLFAGGPLGIGNQWFPWVHLADELGAIIFALETPAVRGPINVASPHAVRLSEFCRTLGRTLHRPSWAPVPAFILRTILGEMADGLLLTSQRVVPKKLLELGYTFKYERLETALADLFPAEKISTGAPDG